MTVSSQLLSELLPGPVTVVFERTVGLNPDLNPGTSLVGIRVPNHGFVREICEKCAEPLALTSANISSEPSALTVKVGPVYSLYDILCRLKQKGRAIITFIQNSVYL